MPSSNVDAAATGRPRPVAGLSRQLRVRTGRGRSASGVSLDALAQANAGSVTLRGVSFVLVPKVLRKTIWAYLC